MPRRKTTIKAVHQADANHQVLSLTTEVSDRTSFRRTPCRECPWRSDIPAGAFPAEAFRYSAKTAYDMADSTFACHVSGARKPTTCAGFLLRGADHNLSVRLAIAADRFDPDEVHSGGLELYAGYRSMAIANGVHPDDPAIAPCRGGDELDFLSRPYRRQQGA
ncbi:DUF6283 family protein [Bosea sp. RAC05]|uniref:DUF6283 family protein n=1 Tax=Bosea sp. RAC05 TaxID=1842539 RepID=UPI00083DD397|nr:DUF6283 family protein [Bosea sp. RAC05]AOG03415.1 hypothetical protein BSY19_5357 [Bosea sp. RAC05]